jgi:hypothetical protein
MEKCLLLLGVLSLTFSAGNVIYIKLLSLRLTKYKFHKYVIEKEEICNLPHRGIRKQPYPVRLSVMSAIKFTPLGAIQPLSLCYVEKPVGSWLLGFFVELWTVCCICSYTYTFHVYGDLKSK